ncbi:hypothetical protein [Affinirhizobium pseudoryzae]|uniref:hypothetical protein n=1 Tax=Allorhizobium pseudoryzae TaxID=379684 RepID=UPI0013EB396F|nr:hypothetical protein [Allorhizobium pseudoryzae]
MHPLVEKIINAHGGLERWSSFSTLTAHLKQGGALWMLKGHAGRLDDTNVTVSLHEAWASHHPFGKEGLVSSFTPDLVQLKDAAGNVLEDLHNPRASFAGHALETLWSQIQLAYFAGIAMWTYLTMPFLLATPGVQIEEVGPWQEKEETWTRLKVTFPPTIATHSTIQTIYVDAHSLLKRHDYDVEIAGNTPGAHYIDGYVEVQGLKFPTIRRIFPRQPDGQAMAEPLVVSIDLADIRLV